MSRAIVIVGGNGKVARLTAQKLSKQYRVTSIIRDPSQAESIKELGATPLVLSVEDASKEDFAKAFKGASDVIWAAGAGGRGGPARTDKVDRQGAIKVFDAIESLSSPPRVITVSAIDARDRNKRPDHYSDADIEASKKGYQAIGAYYDAKLAADRDLSQRSFKWVILRPGKLLDDQATGKIDLGILPLTPQTDVTREDVAGVLAELIERQDLTSVAFDLRNGATPLKEAVDQAVEKNLSKLNF